MPPRRNSTLLALLALAGATAALLVWDRAQPTTAGARRAARALVPEAALARTVTITSDGRTHLAARRGDDWYIGDRLARGAALEALLAELELGEVLGNATIPDRTPQGAVVLGATRVTIFGTALDGRYVERCVGTRCEDLVTQARLVELLHPEGGWLEPGD